MRITQTSVSALLSTYPHLPLPSHAAVPCLPLNPLQSAFDRLLASVPFKGQVLNQTSAWWMKNTTHIVKNALLSTPDPNVAVMKKCKVFPVEFVCRGFMTGEEGWFAVLDV